MSNSPEVEFRDRNAMDAIIGWGCALWRGRLLLLASVLVAVICAVVYLKMAAYLYTASLDLTPVETQSGSGGIAGQLGNLGSLGSLVGLNLSTNQANPSFLLYMEGLKSRAVADDIAKNQDIMVKLFPREWDSSSKAWRRPPGVGASVKYALFEVFGSNAFAWRPPGAERVQEFLENKLIVIQSAKKQMVNIRFSNRDPVFARMFLESLNSIVDSRVRQRTLVRTQESINYLSQKLTTVSNVEHQRAIAQALSDQEKLQMMASSTAPFAAEPFGSPQVSDLPTYPEPLAVLAISILLGLFLGSFYLVLHTMFIMQKD